VRPVRGDRVQLLEIVTNLLENATRVSPDGQAVEIVLDRNGEGQTLTVRDRGPGIHAKECLGIYVAKSYLELMHGTIEAGNHPDGGSRVVCRIPEWRES